VPAFLTLLGEKSWYMPGWLDRVLPNITIEPPHDGEEAGSISLEPEPASDPTGGG
jgi:RND superfamily putative drug exporter